MTDELARIFANLTERQEMGDDRLVPQVAGVAQTFVDSWARMRLLSGVVNAAARVLGRRGRIGFSTATFGDLAAAVAERRDLVLFASGARDIRWGLQRRAAFVPLLRERAVIERQIVSLASNGPVEWSLVDGAVAQIAAAIRRSGIDALVVWNDMTAMERAMIAGARRVGVPSFVLQHGLYLTAYADARIVGGADADFSLVWSQYFSDYFSKAGIVPADRIAVSGYPHRTEPADVATGAIDVCILGQDWERIRSDLGDAKLDVTAMVIDACRALGLSYVYRPHPSERRSHVEDAIDGVVFSPAGQSLRECFETCRTFVSINSTALIEAGLAGRTGVQILAPAFGDDDFEEIGASYSVRADPAEIKEFLRRSRDGELSPVSVRDSYVHVPDDRVTSLLEAIDSLALRN